MSKAPDRCVYCDGTGWNDNGFECGFCTGGKPLDTQEDWDRTWGRILGEGQAGPPAERTDET